MSTYRQDASNPGRKYRLYPAYCFRASPTYNAWVKLTVADVHALRSEPEFQGQNIYFHLNHPIRYVTIVGVVVAINDINLRYTTLTIDDSSGECMEVKIVRLPSEVSSSIDCPSNTTVDNVDILVHLGIFEVLIDKQCIDIGSVIKAKGTISEFRKQRQLELKRVWTLNDTDAEAQAWADMAKFKRELLNFPWHINSSEHKKIKRDIKAEKKQDIEYQRKKAEYEAKKKEKRRAREERHAQWEAKYERIRRKEEIIMNYGALI